METTQRKDTEWKGTLYPALFTKTFSIQAMAKETSTTVPPGKEQVQPGTTGSFPPPTTKRGPEISKEDDKKPRNYPQCLERGK